MEGAMPGTDGRMRRRSILLGAVLAVAVAMGLGPGDSEARVVRLTAPRDTLEIRLEPGERAVTVVLDGWVCVRGARDFPSPRRMVEHFRKGAVGRFDPRTPPGPLDRYIVQQYLTDRFLRDPAVVLGKIRIRFHRNPRVRVDAPPGGRRVHVFRCVREERFRRYFAAVGEALSADLWRQWQGLRSFRIREPDGREDRLDLTPGLEPPPGRPPRGRRSPSTRKLPAREIRIVVVREARVRPAERGAPGKREAPRGRPEPRGRDRSAAGTVTGGGHRVVTEGRSGTR